eukprot:6490783-Amphidinium_carterae.1
MAAKTANPDAWLFSQPSLTPTLHPPPSKRLEYSRYDVLTSLAWLLRQPLQMHGSSAKTWESHLSPQPFTPKQKISV